MDDLSATGKPPNNLPTALTIAGFDPSSGAGITADLFVFAAHGIFATSAMTATTVQSTRGVFGVHPVGTEVLRHTLERLEEDLPPAGIKIGMLAGAEQVAAVAEYVSSVRKLRPLTVVLDPVLRSSSGAVLLSDDGLEVLQRDLLPLVDAVTPNLSEVNVLTGMPCANAEQMEQGAAALRLRYPGLCVVVTGGHLDPPDDLLVSESSTDWLAGERLVTSATHGTGCAFSSALLANRLRGSSWLDSAIGAKQYVRRAIETATPRGGGNGPMNLLIMPESCRKQISSEYGLRR